MLVPAYDDAAGVTAAFNLNVLDVLNHRLGADFDRSAFEHSRSGTPSKSGSRCGCGPAATWSSQMPGLGPAGGRSPRRGDPHRDLGEVPPGRLTAELAAAGFVERGWWTDEQEWFSVSLWGAGLGIADGDRRSASRARTPAGGTDRGRHLLDLVLGVTEQHRGIGLVEQRVLHARRTRWPSTA